MDSTVLASSTTKTGRHDIAAEILLIVALNTKNLIKSNQSRKHDHGHCSTLKTCVNK
jgi:hypothetical protein